MHQPEMTCVIAEDETLLRDALVAAAGAKRGRNCASSPPATTAAARSRPSPTHQPDVAFLDIRMPGLTGLEVAAGALEASPATQVVFVTAYDQYAIDAFDKGAVDYLLKPIAPRAPGERPCSACRRGPARPGRGDGALAGLLQQLSSALPAAAKSPPLVWLTASAARIRA